jgi:acetylornithine deacetylase
VDEATRLLADLVRIPSINPMGRSEASEESGYFEGRLTSYLESFFRDLGVPCRRQPVLPGRDNLLAFYEAPKSKTTILFDAHQDTVPVDGMTIEPFAARIESGRLYGRGACDIKGGLAAMLAAFARLVRERPANSASVVMACTVDEEYTHRGSSALAADPPAKVDLAIVAEPTGFDVITTHKGAVRWRIGAAGTACHSSTPEQGDNAIYRMGRVLAVLEPFARELRSSRSDPILGTPSLSVGRIGGGASVNTVPDSCSIEIDRRLLPGEGAEEARAQVIRVLQSRLTPSDFERLSFSEPWVSMPALRSEAPRETVEAVRGVVERATGRMARVDGVPFGTDAGPLGQAGIPCIVLGPGDIAQAHTRDEWIDLEQLRIAVDVYRGIAMAFG